MNEGVRIVEVSGRSGRGGEGFGDFGEFRCRFAHCELGRAGRGVRGGVGLGRGVIGRRREFLTMRGEIGNFHSYCSYRDYTGAHILASSCGAGQRHLSRQFLLVTSHQLLELLDQDSNDTLRKFTADRMPISALTLTYLSLIHI